MSADDTCDLPDDIKNFDVPSVPRWYDFGRTETPEEVAYREAFFTTEQIDKENSSSGAATARFKVPVDPAPPRPTNGATSSSSSSGTLLATSAGATTARESGAVSSPMLSHLAAFRGPRAPLRRSNQPQPTNQGVNRLNISRDSDKTTSATERHSRRPSAAAAAAARLPAAAGGDRAGPAATAGGVRVAASRAPVRVGALIPAASSFLAASARGATAAHPPAARAAATPRGGGGETAARKPSAESIARLSAPRVRQSSVGAATTPKREFSSDLRAYPRDNRPAGTCTIPQTPIFRVNRRASSESRVAAAAAAGGEAAAASPRPHADVARLVTRLPQTRAQHAAAAAADAVAMPPPHLPQARRLPVVPLGRTHGRPVVRRTTTNTPTSGWARSRSSSAARTVTGGVLQGTGARRAAPSTEEMQK